MESPASFVGAADAAQSPIRAESAGRTSVRSILLVVLCTAIGAAAQILVRHGADYVDGALLEQSPWLFAVSLATNWTLIGGYACLALNMVLLVVALREGQLSILYPIIALTYVWVTILSPMFFHDVINVYKVVGVGIIVLGVSLIGMGSRS